MPPVRRLPSQRTPDDFKLKAIKADRELRRDTAYRAEFPNVPIAVSEIAVTLTPEEYEMLSALKQSGRHGHTDGEVLRDVTFSWWGETFLAATDLFD